jgi:hypothetical protein
MVYFSMDKSVFVRYVSHVDETFEELREITKLLTHAPKPPLPKDSVNEYVVFVLVKVSARLGID